MEKLLLILKLCLLTTLSLGQNSNEPLEKSNFLSSSYQVFKSRIEPMCVTRTSGSQEKIWPIGQSIENLIDLIERLELNLENDTDTNLRQHVGAENVAMLFLRRFRFDGYDRNASSLPYQRARDINLNDIANAFFVKSGNVQDDPTYYFPDRLFTQTQLCSLYNMLSHSVFNIEINPRQSYSAQLFHGKRRKRQTYNNRQTYGQQNANQNQRQNQYRQYSDTNTNTNNNNNNRAINSNYLEKHPIREEGVVSFRGNPNEAIAPARVLIGVIAGLSQNLRTSASEISAQLKGPLSKDEQIDPIMALTLADLWGLGTGHQEDDRNYYYGKGGQWSSGSCTTHFALTDVQLSTYEKFMGTFKATKAEIRGGIDGYLIGKNLRSIGAQDMKKLRLSTILRSYYSKPKITVSNKFTISYCNRNQLNINDVQTTAKTYATIMYKALINSEKFNEPLLSEFSNAFSAAAQTDQSNGLNDYCSSMPSGTLDKNAPCETPSDVIYIVDGTSQEKLQNSAKIVSQINGNLINMATEGGTVSIFANSPLSGQSSPNQDIINLIMPKGPEQWPLMPMAFNCTSPATASCRIDDFNTTTLNPIPNTGKYFKYLNQTLFFYEWWNPRTNASGIPGKTAVLIDFDSVTGKPDSGPDRSDYNYYKDQLRYRHRDVKFLSLANNQDLFKDIIREDNDKDSPNNVQQSASQLARRICENPATFQYNMCDYKKSRDVQYVGFVTPGYKQNWAMYPEFFLKSFDIKFYFKPEDGDIKVCYSRDPTPDTNCVDLKAGTEDYFSISNPCKGKSMSSCDPFYFTVWGKERTVNTPCSDSRCLTPEQIKFTVTHSGVQCSSSNHLLPSTTFQLISLSIFAILYLFFNK